MIVSSEGGPWDPSASVGMTHSCRFERSREISRLLHLFGNRLNRGAVSSLRFGRERNQGRILGARILSFVLFLFLLASLNTSCSRDSKDRPGQPSPLPGFNPVRSLFSTEETAGFFDAPFPVEHMRRENGSIRYNLLPNPRNNPVAQHYIDQADRETNGFSRAGAVYLPFNGPIDSSKLPQTPEASLRESAKVFLVNVDRASARYGQRIPVYTRWQAQPTVYLPGNLLMLLPYQGVPLAPDALYAAVVLASVGDPDGHDLAPADAIVTMRNGGFPEGAYGAEDAAAFTHLWQYCDEAGIPRGQVVQATVFRSGEFVSEMKALRDVAASRPDPIPYDLSLLVEYETYSIVQGKMVMPIWQDGRRPYWCGGGRIHFNQGEPVHQWDEEIRFAVSVPHARMPENGFPLLFYANGQGGSFTQVFDRGPTNEASGTPGTGPGLQLAHRGIACLDIEAATVGPRHPQGSTEGLAFFNFLNLVAFRDNVRQAASEFTLLIKMARNLQIPRHLVPRADTEQATIRYDDANFYFWGHSTGASIGELALAVEPGFRAGMVSGAGVSWDYNIVMKEQPFRLEPLFRLLTGADEIHAFHPFALIFQNLCEQAEAAYFAEHWIHDPIVENRPLDVLIVMGIYDKYFPPLMVDGLIVAAGTDLAGPVEREETRSALELSGRCSIPLPAGGNIEAGERSRTGLAIQYALPDGVDGHYAPFYLPQAKYQYTCFFESLAKTGTATVPEKNVDSFASCGFDAF